MYVWAGVSFLALGGQTTDFLQRAAMQHFRLRCVYPVSGGVMARCSACDYVSLGKLAKTCRVRLRVRKRHGLYYTLRALLCHKGAWAAIGLFVAFLFVQQNLIWYVDGSTLTHGQRARVAQILWEECGIAPGAYSSEALLAQAEEILLSDTHEFSWVSLNFDRGRLTVEGNVARLVPEIARGESNDMVASTAGEIVQVNVQQGTPMVMQGQKVVEGQILISAARLEHDQETLNYTPVKGQVLAKFNVMDTIEIQKEQLLNLPKAPLNVEKSYQILVFGHLLTSPFQLLSEDEDKEQQANGNGDVSLCASLTDDQISANDVVTVRRRQCNCLGFLLPITLIETDIVHYVPTRMQYSSNQAIDLAAQACKERLYRQYTDATIETQQVAVQETESSIIYTVCYQVVANIAVWNE